MTNNTYHILYINSLRPFVRDGARVSRRPSPARPVRKVFFQKICGFRARRLGRTGLARRSEFPVPKIFF